MKKGKQICEQLKQIRLDIARKNGIEYTPNECHHEGDCAGTCPACDCELLYLEREISRKRSLGKVAVVGISLGLASLSLTSCLGSGNIQGGIVDATTEMTDTSIQGDLENVDSVPELIDNAQNIDESTND